MLQQPSLSAEILDWYDSHKRNLPWRSKIPNPYYVWLSEIMLQQTTVPTVIPYFLKFIKKWPTLKDLADAALDEILVEWQGLGYYSRARNLHKCAHLIATDFEGHIPKFFIQLKKLPGIGTYTAAAIASIAFDHPETVVEGNIVRIISRLFSISIPYPDSKSQIEKYAQLLTPQKRSGDYAQALMDLGATVCKPRDPLCQQCPLSHHCKAYKANEMVFYPVKKAKGIKPTKYAYAFLIQDKKGRILLRKRPESGLLGGMMEIPSSPWLTELTEIPSSLPFLPLNLLASLKEEGKIKHTFTHFHLQVNILKTQCDSTLEGKWVKPNELSRYALPTLMKKIINKGLGIAHV